MTMSAHRRFRSRVAWLAPLALGNMMILTFRTSWAQEQPAQHDHSQHQQGATQQDHSQHRAQPAKKSATEPKGKAPTKKKPAARNTRATPRRKPAFRNTPVTALQERATSSMLAMRDLHITAAWSDFS